MPGTFVVRNCFTIEKYSLLLSVRLCGAHWGQRSCNLYLEKEIEKLLKKWRENPVLLGTAAWNLTLNSRPLGICLAPCFYDAFSSGPGAAIFLVNVEEVFFVPWPQNLSQTTREKVKVGFAKDIEQGFVSFSVFMMHFHPAQVQQYFLQMLRKYFFTLAAEFISDNKGESERGICEGNRARICQLLCFYDAFSSGATI